jgi:hypothetical protein
MRCSNYRYHRIQRDDDVHERASFDQIVEVSAVSIAAGLIGGAAVGTVIGSSALSGADDRRRRFGDDVDGDHDSRSGR